MMGREQYPSPNHDARPAGTRIDMLILHYTGMADEEAAIRRLSDPASKVSTHWLVRESGGIVEMVDESRRAWHAGLSYWAGRSALNSCSIGIEIQNPGHEFGYRAFPDAQIDAVIELCRAILSRHDIPPQRVLGHSDVAPARKSDPGELFPWHLLHASGIGHWIEPAPLRLDGPVLEPGAEGSEMAGLQHELSRYGYGVPTHGRYDAETMAVVTAFQRHFRQQLVDGRADLSTRETLKRLLSAGI